MRLELVGYSGVRPPVPTTIVGVPGGGDPVGDPDWTPPAPLTLLLSNGDEFHKADYLALGYNRFDVMCFGAAGGRGGGFWWKTGPTADGSRVVYGGSAGGGGVHRIKGRLALLPSICPVIVGQPGADVPFVFDNSGGNGVNVDINHIAPAAYVALPPAGDGGFSSFNGETCKASGGKGGQKAAWASYPDGGGLGGEGGKGGTIIPGGGGGSAGQPAQGTWDGVIGKGGMGGRGGSRTYYDNPFNGSDLWTTQDETHRFNSTPGAKGAYSAAAPEVSGVGAPVDYEHINWVRRVFADGVTPTYTALVDGATIRPGAGGGATAFPLNGAPLQYGSHAGGVGASIAPGGVVIRLTYLSL